MADFTVAERELAQWLSEHHNCLCPECDYDNIKKNSYDDMMDEWLLTARAMLMHKNYFEAAIATISIIGAKNIIMETVKSHFKEEGGR